MFDFSQTTTIAPTSARSSARLGIVLFCAWWMGLCWLTTWMAGGNVVRLWIGPVGTLVAGVALLLLWLGYWRWSARVLVVSGISAGGVMALYAPFLPVVSVLVQAVFVVFAGWTLGIAHAGVAAVFVILFMLALMEAGRVGWGQALLMAYIVLFLLGMTWMMVQGYRRHLQHLRASLQESQTHRQQLQVLFQAMEQSPDCVLVVNLEGLVMYANPAFEQRSGYSRSQIKGLPSRQVSMTGMTQVQYTQMRARVEAGKPWQGVVHNRLKDGRAVVDEVRIAPVLDDAGQLSYWLERSFDISERIAAENQILHLQKYDALTQLPNRQTLLEKLDALQDAAPQHLGLHSADGHHDWHGLLLLEVDRFHSLESTRGQLWADALLQALVERLRELAPASAMLARIRGSQLAVVVPAVSPSRHEARLHAFDVAQELQNGLRTLEVTALQEGAEDVKLTCSVGFTVFPLLEEGQQHDSSSHVLRRASVALSQALHQGGNQVRAYSARLDASMQRRMEVEKDLAVALQEGQLQLFLQPQVDTYGRVTGAEALLRWPHPHKGMVPPAEFIPVAEDCGLIVPLGDWVLEQACWLLSDPRAQQAGHGISVNVSALQFKRSDFVRKVTNVLQRTHANPQRLTLEVTESLLLSDVEQAIQTMRQLRALGVRFALDDFGTGYSSLAYLMRLPIQEIKLDQAFVRGLQTSADNRVLVEAILMIAKAKALQVVAEGVETKEQAELLQALEPGILCQGFWFSPAVLAQDWLDAPVLSGPSTAG